MLTTRVVDSLHTLQALSPKWRELLQRSAAPSVTQTPTWLCNWWRVFGEQDRRTLQAITLTDERGNLVALAPLLRRPVRAAGALPVSRLELLATGEEEQDETCSPYVGVLADRARVGEVAEHLAELLIRGAVGTWDELLLPSMAEDDPMVDELQASLARRGVAVAVTPYGTSSVLALPASWDDYLASRKGNHRYFVRRTLRDLESWAGEGGFSLRVCATPDEVARAQPVLYELHRARWALDDREGVFASARFRRFHELVMRDLDGEDGRAELVCLDVDGRTVAILYNFVFDGRVYFYQSGRRTDLPKQVRPGIAIHLLAIQHAIERGLRAYDFLEGERMYKAQLASEERGLVQLRAIAPTLRARTLEGTRATLDGAKARARAAYREHGHRLGPLNRILKRPRSDS